MFLKIEAELTLLAVALALIIPNLGSRSFGFLERTFGRLARRQGLSVLVVGLTALALRAALLPILPIPVPGVQDEFAHLLLSDTFAHGRLTNPTTPMWIHFATFHILWHPTYTAKFYPAQGLIMALGQVVFGHPFWGIWLSLGLMCAAITWMLQGWLEPGWALLGGFLAVIRFGTFSYWANSYFGGSVAAIGGALVLGALPRLKKEPRLRYALLMGLGFAILANRRPYEGLFFGIPIAAALGVWLWRKRGPALGLALKRAVAPLLAVLALTVVAMGYYSWRTIGNPLNTPYFYYEHTIDPIPKFPWETLKPIPKWRREVFHKFDLEIYEASQFRRSQSIVGMANIELGAALSFWTFFLGPVFTLPLVLAGIILLILQYGFSWKDVRPETRFLLAVLGVTLFGEALPIWFQPHYAAMLTCVILALVLIALRLVRPWGWSRGKPTGLFITRAVPSICVLLFVLRVGAGITHWPPVPKWPDGLWPTWCSLSPQNLNRAAMLRKLRRYPGRQLVIVHYGQDHNTKWNEWVYNRADLNSAKVLWARDLGPTKNEELIKYFRDRHAWLVYADDRPPKLKPYSETADSESCAVGEREP